MLSRRLATTAAVAALAAAALPAAAGASGGTTIGVQDRCDPATFDAVLGPGACRPMSSSGGTLTFDALIGGLVENREVGAWRFDREKVTIRRGEALDVRMARGGEVHSFTEVASYGKGCVDELNALVFPGSIAEKPPQCSDGTFPATLIGPEIPGAISDHRTISGLSAGTHKFMCLIHPWMKATVTVR